MSRAGQAGGRLGSVLRVRTLFERLALGGLAASEQGVRSAGRQLEDRRRAHAQRPAPAGRLSPIELRALQLQGLATHELTEAARDALDEACQQRDVRAEAWTHASRRRRSVERLVERRGEDEALAARRASQAAMDELAAMRWWRP